MAEPQNGSLSDLVGMDGPKFRVDKPSLPKIEALLSGPGQVREGYVTAEQAFPAFAEQRAEEARLTQEVGLADVAVKGAELEQKRQAAEQKGALVRKQKEELQQLPEAQQLKQKREQFANLTFVPTRDNAEDLAKLFSLIGVIGVAIGGRGRGAALQAMTSMNGMLDGYRRGRADLYKQQLGEFDRSLKTMQQQIGTLEKQLAEAVKLKALDREAGELAIDAALASADSPLLKAIAARQGPVAALNHVRNVGKDFTTLINLKNQQQQRADNIKAREDAARQQREFLQDQQRRQQQFQRDLQASQQAFQTSRGNLQVVQTAQGPRVMDISQLPRATPEELANAIPFKAAGKLSGGLKPDAKERNAYIADNVLLADINDMRKDLQKPSLQKLIKDYRVEAFLTEEGKVLNQLISSGIPNELQVFLTKVRDVRNNYYLDKSGKAVTGGEALRNYGTVPQPGDSAEAILNKFDSLSARVNRTIDIRKQMYGLPQINVKAGDATGVNQGDEIPLRFNTEADVEAANLDPGTLVIVGNRRGRVQAK
jgi:hypothetical protein